MHRQTRSEKIKNKRTYVREINRTMFFGLNEKLLIDKSVPGEDQRMGFVPLKFIDDSGF